MLLTAAVLECHRATTSVHTERLSLGLGGSIFFAIVHFLHEGLGFLFVHEGQSCEALWIL